MIPREVLERMGHDSLVDLTHRILENLDATERHALPQTIMVGLYRCPGVLRAVSYMAGVPGTPLHCELVQGHHGPHRHGPTEWDGSTGTEDAAKPDPFGREPASQFRRGTPDPDPTTRGEGSPTPDLSQSDETDHGPLPDYVLDADGDVWRHVDQGWYRLRDQSKANHRLPWIVDGWGQAVACDAHGNVMGDGL